MKKLMGRIFCAVCLCMGLCMFPAVSGEDVYAQQVGDIAEEDYIISGDYYYILDKNEKATIIRYTGEAKESMVIPEFIDGKEVIGLEDVGYWDYRNDDWTSSGGWYIRHGGVFGYDDVNPRMIRSITLPQRVTSIGDAAFLGFSSLTSITLPQGLTSIGESAFGGCASLTSITLPQGLTSIGKYAFFGCSSMKSITVLNDFCYIYGISNEEGGENTISPTAVIYCNPGSRAEIYAGMYRRRCAAIPENGFGDGSTNGSQTGDQTPGTGNPNGSQTGNQTPSDTPGTAPAAGTKLTDPSGTAFYLVTKSGAEAAYAGTVNKNASSASIPAAVTIDGISYQVTSIAANAFAGQKQLKSVSVGKRVASIGNKAFYNCRELTRITIPAKVKKIGNQAFAGCKKLKSITIKTSLLTKKNVGSKAFSGIHKSAKIKAPKKKLSAYKKILKARGVGSKVKIVK